MASLGSCMRPKGDPRSPPSGCCEHFCCRRSTGETAKDMIVRYSPGAKRITVGADKGFDTADFVSDMRDFNVTPHVAQNTTNRLSAIDGRTIRHCGYEVSQQKRKRVEEPFGWGKTIGGLA